VRAGSTAARARADLAFLRADYFLDLPDFLQPQSTGQSVIQTQECRFIRVLFLFFFESF